MSFISPIQKNEKKNIRHSKYFMRSYKMSKGVCNSAHPVLLDFCEWNRLVTNDSTYKVQ